MNGRTRRSRNVEINRSRTNKKRKSTTEKNIGQRTEGTKTTNAIIRNSGMTSEIDDDSNSDVSSYDSECDSSSGSDDDQDSVENKPRKKSRSKSNSMPYLVRSIDVLTKVVCEVRDDNKKLKEELKIMNDKIEKLTEEKEIGRFRSVVTVDGRPSISDLTPNSSDIDGYFKKERRCIEAKLRKTIYDHTFAQTKFLYERTVTDDEEDQPPTPTELVVLKAMEIKQINVPSEFDKGQFVRKCLPLVAQVYNAVRCRMQQNVRQRWFGKFG